MGRPMFTKKIYFNRSKEANFEVCDEAEELGFSEDSVSQLLYLGYEIEFEVQFEEENGKLITTILRHPKEL